MNLYSYLFVETFFRTVREISLRSNFLFPKCYILENIKKSNRFNRNVMFFFFVKGNQRVGWLGGIWTHDCILHSVIFWNIMASRQAGIFSILKNRSCKFSKITMFYMFGIILLNSNSRSLERGLLNCLNHLYRRDVRMRSATF